VTGSWTPRELATLAAVAETFVRGDAVRRARLTSEALDAAADPSQVRQLRQALRMMESRLANLVLARRPRTYASMSPAARQRYLLTWANSRIGLRRAAFGSLRKLLTYFAYADPGADASGNPRHAVIGYEPEWPPVPHERTPIRPLTLPLSAGSTDEPTTLEADVVVVGSGAGGGVVAAAAAEAGRSVIVLEAGPFVDEATMPRDELAAYDRLYLNHGLVATWDGAITMLAGSAVGGGTLINFMTCIEPPAAIRERWARDHGLDGLRDGEAWSDDIAALERDLSVTPVEQPAPKDVALTHGAEQLGWEVAPIRRNAVGCTDCGSCLFGCSRGSKQSGIRAYLARAAIAGARIVPQVRVTRVLIERGRAVGVEAEAPIPGPPGASVRSRRVIVRSSQVVVAAGALRSPAILQASRARHRAIGRYLRVHPVPVVAGFMPSPTDIWHGPMQGVRSLEFAADERTRNGYVIEAAPGHPGLLATALPWDGLEEHAAWMRQARYILPLVAVTRDGGRGRVTRTRAGHVRIDYELDRIGLATLRHATVSLARLARAAGAGAIVVSATPGLRFDPIDGSPAADDAAFERFVDRLGHMDFSPNRGGVFSAHQMGTLRMGSGRRDHVCDPAGRVRASSRRNKVIGGLYVADTSLFPTAIGVNPMLTVMALARRVARTVMAES
jgi:choline dehydrogenase-like flavoprotein